MMNYRCKCGKSTAVGSMNGPRCEGCDECGTTLEVHPSLWRSPEVHDFVAHKVETDHGSDVLSRCRYCHKTKTELSGEGKGS
jgi:hypothetical protein